MRVSARTLVITVVGLAAIALVRTLVLLEVFNEWWTLLISDLGETLVVAAAAAIVLSVAFSFSRDEPLRKVWLWIGLGVTSFAIGDAVWTYIEVVQGVEVPYPGVPDFFYIAEYVFLGVGVFTAGWAYRHLTDPKGPFVLSAAGAVALMLIVSAGFLWPYVLSEPDISTAERVLSTVYPLADISLLMAPAFFTALMVSKLGGGRLAWPWWAVTAGTVVLATSDTVFAWLSATEAYAAGNIVDSGWMLAHLLVAIGASLARDVVEVRE